MKYLVKIGARNEAQNLPRVLDAVARLRERRVWSKHTARDRRVVDLDSRRARRAFDVLVIDDASNDETPRIVREYQFPVVRCTKNRGISWSHSEAMAYALRGDYDACVTLDGDGQHDPGAHLFEVLDALESGFDFVQCSRYSTALERARTPLDRALLNDAVLGMLQRYVGWEPLTDALCGFWGMRRSLIAAVLPQLSGEGYGFQMEVLLRLWHLNPRPRRKEIPHPAIYRNGTARLDGLYTEEHLMHRMERFKVHALRLLRVVREMGLHVEETEPVSEMLTSAWRSA